MNEIQIAISLGISLSIAYFLLRPFIIQNGDKLTPIIATTQLKGAQSTSAQVSGLILKEELEDLVDLRNRSEITEEDFSAQKALLLEDAEKVI